MHGLGDIRRMNNGATGPIDREKDGWRGSFRHGEKPRLASEVILKILLNAGESETALLEKGDFIISDLALYEALLSIRADEGWNKGNLIRLINGCVFAGIHGTTVPRPSIEMIDHLRRLAIRRYCCICDKEGAKIASEDAEYMYWECDCGRAWKEPKWCERCRKNPVWTRYKQKDLCKDCAPSGRLTEAR